MVSMTAFQADGAGSNPVRRSVDEVSGLQGFVVAEKPHVGATTHSGSIPDSSTQALAVVPSQDLLREAQPLTACETTVICSVKLSGRALGLHPSGRGFESLTEYDVRVPDEGKDAYDFRCKLNLKRFGHCTLSLHI